MNPLEDQLRHELQALEQHLPTPPPPVETVLARGRAARRRRRAGLGVAAVAMAGAAALGPTLLTGGPDPDEPTVVAGRPIAAAAAADLMRSLGSLRGDPYAAWEWNDSSGRGVLLATRQVDQESAGVPLNGVLRVYQATGLGAGGGRVSTVLEATNSSPAQPAPCTLDGGLGFVDGSTTITDVDRDGVAEVTIGWWNSCAGDIAPAQVHLLTLEGDQRYELTGEAEFPRPPQSRSTDPAPVGTPSAQPSSWPPALRREALALYDRLYR
ncbi:MAG: M949_RS01915 family surface polysaccharide biosynthesis protein [Angustibacter sp.]